MKITQGSIVRLDYELRVKGGDVIESSARTGPLQYVQGEGKLLPALEKRLIGLAAGEKLEGEIPAAEVAPAEDTLPTRKIPRKEFPAGDLEVGATFEAHTPTGGTINLHILEVTEEHVNVRLLPPLAGKDLLFKVRVVMIEDPVSHLRELVLKKPPPLPPSAHKAEKKD